MHLLSVLPEEMHDQFILYIDAGYGSEELATALHEAGFKYTIAAPKNKPGYIFSGLQAQLDKDATAYVVKDD